MTTLANDPIVAWLKKMDKPVTRHNFIDLNWGDNPPDPWTGEAEHEIPQELQDWSWLPDYRPEDEDEDYDETDIPDDKDDGA